MRHEIDELKKRGFAAELSYKATRSGGAGGQHVNKVSTKVELRFDLAATSLLSPEEKTRLLHKLTSQLVDEGTLLLTCDETRSQHKNKELVTEKFYATLARALRIDKKRVATKMPKAVKIQLKETKRHTSQKKQNRSADFRQWL